VSTKLPEEKDLPIIVEGRYKILRELGRGGYGSVYLAEDMLLGKPVAMKLLAGFGNMFTALAEITSLVSLPLHPNICPYQGTLTVDGVPVIVMPYAPGGTLADASQGISGNTVRIVELALQAAFGLSQIHASELTHGDVKPQNLLIFEDWRLAVGDFGLALQQSQAQFGPIGGTDAYLPFDEIGSTDLKGIDWYSWALTFIEVSIGQRQWQRGADAFAILNRNGVLETSSEVNVPRTLARLLVASSGARDEVARELVDELNAIYLELAGKPAPVPPPLVPRPQEISTYTPGFQRLDLAGPVFGPEVLLVRAISAARKEGLEVSTIDTVHPEIDSPSNRTAYLAGSIVTYGRIVDALGAMGNGSLQPLIADAWSEMGLAYTYLGDPLGAVWAHKEAFEVLDRPSADSDDEKLEQKTAGISLRLAGSLADIGEFEQACAVIRRGLQHARNLTAKLDLGIVYANAQSDMGRYEAAYKAYSDLIAMLDPKMHAYHLARLYHERGSCLSCLNRLLEAELDVRRSLEFINSSIEGDGGTILQTTLTGQLPLTLRLLGTVLTDSGKHSEAVKTYDLAIKSYRDASDLMLETELEDRIASIELSKSFSLRGLKDDKASDAALMQSIERRRRLLAGGYDATAPGLANSLVALAERHLAKGEQMAARSVVAECLRISQTLEARGSKYHVHDIALRCLILFLDKVPDIEDEFREQMMRWAITELDVMDSIAGSAEYAKDRNTRRARLLFNFANYTTSVPGKLTLLDAAANLATEQNENNDSSLICEILIKRAAIKHGNDLHDEALTDAAKAVQIAREYIRLHSELGDAEIARYRVQLANSLMFIAVISTASGSNIGSENSLSPADAASESVSILRAINPEDLQAHECAGAAQTFGVAGNFLPPDPQRDASDAVYAFRLSVHALKESPSSQNLQAVSLFAQRSTRRLLDCDETDGAQRILHIARSLPGVIVFPDSTREPALAMLADLIAHLESQHLQKRMQ
jgi:serine/threonine protein kinase